MKIFFKKVAVFHGLVLITILLIVFIPIFVIKKNSTFKLKENKTIALFGHSHPECAFNDSIISDIRNLANAAESYFYTFQKIKKIIPENPQIKTVFIEFTNNQIDKKAEQWIWGYDKMSNAFPTYSPFINTEDFNLLFKNNFKDLVTCISISSKKNLIRIINSNYTFVENMGFRPRIDRDELENDRNKNLHNKSLDNFDISEVNLQYLRKIIDYCRSQKIEIYLIRTPTHKDYKYVKNEKKFQEIRNKDFSDVEFLDFIYFITSDEHFSDLDHLNYKGAEVFSEKISKLLDEGLLDSENKKQKIIDFIKKN